MKKHTFFLFVLFSSCLLFENPAHSQTTIGGAGANYATLKAAFDAINAGTITGAITLQITGSTTETASAVLNASGTGSSSYSAVHIYPTVSGKSISGSFAAPLIDLNGADNVTIDGRLNASGSTKDLVINNSSISGAGATSTIRLINDATSNTIKYCTLKGANTNALSGIIFLSTTNATTGNDGNTIDNNNITGSSDATRPANAIYSSGTATKENSGNTFSNNNIYDFFNPANASCGISFYANSTGETILGNSFYETTSFSPSAGNAYSIIKINNASGNGYTISGNYIGGSQSLCGGSAWSKSNSADNIFYGVNLNVGTTPETSVQNNTIRNISWSNSGAASWTGIQITVGAVNTGTSTGNTIGAATGTGSITVTGGTNGANVYGIYIQGAGTNVCQNNTIGSITAANSDPTCATNVYGIYRFNTTTNTFSNNIIGSTTTSNSIQATSTSSLNSQIVMGIYNSTGGTFNANNNTIANLTNSTTNSNAATAGVTNGIASISAVNNITNNTIRDLSNANANNSASNTASVCGIALTVSNSLNTISGNAIYNLVNSYASFSGCVIGIYYGSTGSSHTVSGSFIHDLSLTGAFASGSLYGIKINSGNTTYYNNIIDLGGNSAATLYGIYETGATGNNNTLYFNTIYITGTPTTGTSNSYALYSAVNTNTRNFRNNIFDNARSNSGATGKHYAAYFNYTGNAALTLDFNDYYAPGSGGMLGYYNSVDVNTLPVVIGKDASSISYDPLFANAGGNAATDYIPASARLEGTPINSYTTDYSSATRAGTPTMGALEGTLNLYVSVYKAGALQSRFTLLRYAFDKINDGTLTGALEIRVSGNTAETATAVLYQSGYTNAGTTSNYTSAVIYPTVSGVTISGNLNNPLVDLNGSDYVIIDGRVNQSGSSVALTLTNSSTATYAGTIRFYNSAENNDIKYCNLYGSGTGSSTGVINVNGTSVGNGNDNNIIENCNISNAGGNRPVNTIYFSGTSTRENSGVIIRDNNIFDFLNTGTGSYGINFTSNSTGCTISGNSFYETTTFIPTAAVSYNVIRVTAGDGNLISGNYIGGSAAHCGGSAWTVNSSVPHYLCGIYVGFPSGTTNTVQNNIMQNMSYTSTQSNPWDGFFINSGNVNITGNTIGSTTGTGSIVNTTPCAVATTTLSGGQVATINILSGGSGYTTAPLITFTAPPAGGTAPTATATITGGVVTLITLNTPGSGYTSAPAVVFDGQTNGYSTSHGIIQNSTGTVNITSNNIGSITTVGSAFYSHGFETIYVRGIVATTTFTNNLIGSLTTANSIYTSTTAASSLTKQDVYGIYSSSTGTTTITGNTVANLTNGYTGLNSQARTRGIQTTSGSNTIQNNTVRNLTSYSKQSSAGTAASVIGISQTSGTIGTTQTLSGNTVYSISNNSATAQVFVTGLFYTGPTTGSYTISGNFIHSLSVSSSDLTSNIKGIEVNNGSVSCFNNVINLGAEITGGYKINGIWEESSSGSYVKSILFNAVYIGGSIPAGTTSNTCCLWNQNNYSTRDFRNNVLHNARTGGITGKHYAVSLNGTTGLTIDYNDYYTSGTGGILGYLGSDKNTLALFKSGTGQDVNSLNTNPAFSNAGGFTATDYYTSADLPGTAGTGILTDYTGLTRNLVPKMGALERTSFTWKGNTSSDFGTASNWTENDIPGGGSKITFDAAPANHCVLDHNRILGDIIDSQNIKNLVVNGKQLTITGALNFSNSAKIDASAASSTVVLAGALTQTIPSGMFSNNEVQNLTITNVNNVVLNGTLRLLKILTTTSGKLDAFTNSPTLVYAGTTAQFLGNNQVLNDKIYNLTIDNPAGFSLNADLTVANSCTINTGALFTVYPGKKLSVAGTLTNNAGAAGFVLQSTPAGTASLLHNTNNVSATVQRSMGTVSSIWHFLSSPVASQTIAGAWLPAGNYHNGTGYDLYTWDEPSSFWISRLDTTSNINWNTVHPWSTFVPGRAYLYSVENPAAIKTFVGPLNNGAINYSLTYSGTDPAMKGFNMVGNPYPSSVDWQSASGWSRSALVSNGGGYDMWIWNPSANNYGICNSIPGSTGTNSVTRYIAPMQGYLVKAASAGTFTIDNAARVLDNTPWIKNAEQSPSQLNLIVNSNAGNGFDEVQLSFGLPLNENGAMKLFSTVQSAPSLFLPAQRENLSVRYYTNTIENPAVPVSFTPGTEGNFTFTCNFDKEKFDSVMLEDHLLHSSQNMKITNTYSFQSSKTDITDRFVLRFGPDVKHSTTELPAKIYTDGSHVIIDLTAVPENTTVFVYNVIGQVIFSQNLAGAAKHVLDLNSSSQLLVICLKNPYGTLSRKILYGRNW